MFKIGIPFLRPAATAIVRTFAALALSAIGSGAHAANSEGCEGGGFVVSGLADGSSISAQGETVIAAARVGQLLRVKGKYNEFLIPTATFGIRDFAFTGAPNPLDLTGGRRVLVWASKTPDHRGLGLNSAAELSIDGPDLVIERSGPGLHMKIQAKDCAQGGVFQMEPERADGTMTLITHTLASGVFYFDNPNFRAREGDVVPYKDTTIVVPDRINIANAVSKAFVARDSAQVADRIDEPSCVNRIKTRTGVLETVLHCGQVTRWNVASGGRMGFVTGEDAIEVAPPATECTRKCQAQNRVRGRSVKLGFPFPVPTAVRLKPDAPSVAPVASR